MTRVGRDSERHRELQRVVQYDLWMFFSEAILSNTNKLVIAIISLFTYVKFYLIDRGVKKYFISEYASLTDL